MIWLKNKFTPQMPRDKRRWTTPEQALWLQEQFPSYLEAQALRRYDKFWPSFFQKWFEKFPAPQPAWDAPTDSEHESDSDSEQTDAGEVVLASKRKRKGNK
jgi:hypothetical protein